MSLELDQHAWRWSKMVNLIVADTHGISDFGGFRKSVLDHVRASVELLPAYAAKLPDVLP